MHVGQQRVAVELLVVVEGQAPKAHAGAQVEGEGLVALGRDPHTGGVAAVPARSRRRGKESSPERRGNVMSINESPHAHRWQWMGLAGNSSLTIVTSAHRVY